MAGAGKLTVRWIGTVDLIQDGSLANPTRLRPWKRLSFLGSIPLLTRPALGLFCSIRCPGKVILQMYDLARALRDAGVSVVGGFHTPMEKECLDLLLRGAQPVILCPARSVENLRLPAAIRAGVEAERLLVLSPFEAKQRRATAALAEERNRFVAALAGEVFVAYAAPGGRTEQLCRELIAAGKPVLTVDCTENANLLALGARPTGIRELVRRWAAGPAGV